LTEGFYSRVELQTPCLKIFAGWTFRETLLRKVI